MKGRLAKAGWAASISASTTSSAAGAAIKILQPQFASNPEMVERFLRAARAAARADHPQIGKILDYGLTPEKLPYLALEYLDGEPMSKHIKARGRLPLVETLRIGQQLAAHWPPRTPGRSCAAT